jgi:hypothetical protein
VILPADFDARRNNIPNGARLVLVRDNPNTHLRVDAVNPPNVTVTQLHHTTLQELNPTRTQVGQLAQLLAMSSVYGVEHNGVVTADVDQRPYPAAGAAGIEVKSDRNLAMAFHGSGYAFGHFSYNMLSEKGTNLADNEHLTVENSLATMFATLGDGRDTSTHQEGSFPASLEDTGFWDSRIHLMKGEHQQRANQLGYASVDNINFRPTAQQPRALTDLGQTIRPSNQQLAGAGTVRSGTLPTDQQITLERLYALARTACANLKLAALWNQIRQSMETVRGAAGFAATDLHLNQGQRREFLKLALTMNDVAQMGFVVPAEFAQFHRVGSPIVVGPGSAVPDQVAQGFITTLRREQADGNGNWLVREGENHRNYNEISTALIAANWAAVSNWIVHL